MKKLFLLLFLAVPLLGEEAPTPPPPATTPQGGGRTRLFQIVLVRGALGGSEEIVGIPKNAEKAIRDLRDFLPFRSYKMLDTGLLRIRENDSGKIKLEGIAPQQYEVFVAAMPGANGKISIWSFSVKAVRVRSTPLPAGVAPEAERPIIDTSFSIDPGETVVVGTSKLGGDQALIVLFTALPNS